MKDSKWVDEPIPMSGWPALRRWLVCKLGQHGRTSEQWESIGEGKITRRTVTAWCGDCGRVLKPAERAHCRECGQGISYRQAPRDMERVPRG